MIDIKVLQDKVNNAIGNLEKAKKELADAKINNMKELYGNDFSCSKCAYSCCIYVGDYHNVCTKGSCVLCRDFCDEYMPENILSKYIRENHHYCDDLCDTLNELFDVSDILKEETLHEKAIQVLKIARKK